MAFLPNPSTLPDQLKNIAQALKFIARVMLLISHHCVIPDIYEKPLSLGSKIFI